MPWAPVPKAPINEYGNALPAPRKVGLPWQWLVASPPAQARTPEEAGQCQLRAPVLPPLHRAHDPAARFRRVTELYAQPHPPGGTRIDVEPLGWSR